jgi:hypothetical protein
MSTSPDLDSYLSQWLAAQQNGRDLSAHDLLPDRPTQQALLRVEIAKRRAVLRNLYPPNDPPSQLPTLSGFRLIGELGRGGMGVVYLAEDIGLGRAVAIKMMRPEAALHPQARARFLREARAVAKLANDHVIPIYQVVDSPDAVFIAMPLLQGETVADRLERLKTFTPAEAVELGRQAALGLAAAHAAGLIHRDIKPANLWLEPHGASFRVKLLDFGLAHDASSADGLTQSGAIMGTPAYMSPEQADGLKTDTRTDLFSLGVVLYEALTGQSPFKRDTNSAILNAVVNYEPPAVQSMVPDLPPALAAIVTLMLAKRVEVRPASAQAVALALGASGVPASTPTPVPLAPPAGAMTQPTLLHRAPRRWSAWLSVGGGVLVLLVGAWCLWPTNPSGVVPHVEAEPDLVLRVKRMTTFHTRRVNIDGVEYGEAKGELLGSTELPQLRLNDQITLDIELTRPAYAYVLAFKPDKQIELCYPGAETQPPPMSAHSRLRVPPNEQHAFTLFEGTGAWVFAVVASDRPLPAFADWRAAHPLTWDKHPDTSGTVWWHNGQLCEPVWTANGRTTRSVTETLQEAGLQVPLKAVVHRLQQLMPEATIAGTAFAVGENK